MELNYVILDDIKWLQCTQWSILWAIFPVMNLIATFVLLQHAQISYSHFD